MEEVRKDIKTERLEKLRQATIVNYGEIVDFDSNLGLYESMIEHLLKGDYDDIFLTESLNECENKKEVFELARKYSSLCFYRGDSSYWLDSIEGVVLSDPRLVSLKLLDNYDFLLRLAANGKEDALKELLTLQKYNDYDGNSMIDHLRNTFINDNVLENTIIEMSSEDGVYKDFTDSEKSLLISYPEGVIYTVEEANKYRKIKVVDITKKIKDYLTAGEDNMLDDEGLRKVLHSLNDMEFDEIINNITMDYQMGAVKK